MTSHWELSETKTEGKREKGMEGGGEEEREREIKSFQRKKKKPLSK